MKLATEQRAWINLGLVVGLALLCVMWFLAVQQPGLASQRLTLDTDRVILTTFIEQKSNLSQLEAQAAELTGQQASLAPELWHFTSEQQFFSGWDTFGREHHVTIDVPHVADVVPGDLPVRRNAQLIIDGSAAAVFESLSALASLQPLVAIQEVKLEPGSDPGLVTASLGVETVWQ